jgi:hypothetical protein
VETVNLATLLTYQGAAADALALPKLPTDSLATRLDSLTAAAELALESGWRTLLPDRGLRSGILLLEAARELTKSGHEELEGYLLNNREDLACVFLDRRTNLCSIYDTRPLTCRLFDCDGAGSEQLIELGILSRESTDRQGVC